MFKRFPGAHLMEELQRKKLHKLMSTDLFASRLAKILIASITMIVLWTIPTTSFGIDGLTLVEQRVIASFTSNPVFVAAMAIIKPPMNSIMIGSAKQAINDL